jgi:protein kinase A
LKNGVNDIKGHRFFNGMNWTKLLARELKPPYIPNVKGEGDTTCFAPCPDSDTVTSAVKPSEDPFLDW